jgi:hypothetical protein
MDMCHPEPESVMDPETGAEIWTLDEGGPCKGDINRIIRELERIPDIELSLAPPKCSPSSRYREIDRRTLKQPRKRTFESA